VNLGQQIDLEVGRERVGETHVPREGTQDQVAELDARMGDDITEAEVVVAQELGEVVQQNQKNTQRSLVQGSGRVTHLAANKEGDQEAEQRYKKLLEGCPALAILSQQELGHECTVRDQRQPSISESREHKWLQRLESVAI